MAETNPWAKYIADNQARIDNDKKNIARDQALLAAGQGDPRTLNLQIQAGLDDIAALQQQIDTLYLPEYNQWNANRLAPPASAGGVVGNANQAREDNANATRPITGEQVAQPDGRITSAGGDAPTNAQTTPTNKNNPTTGTDDPLRPTTQTQAINNQNDQLVPGPPNTQASVRAIDNAIAATGGPGAASRGDDNTPPTPSVLVNRLDALYAGTNNHISTQANILDNFFSYTYSLSWYLVDPTLYNTANFPNLSKDITGYYLLAQSGGAGSNAGAEVNGPNVGVSVPQYGYNSPDSSGRRVLGAERSPYFNLDFYIDNLELSTVYSCNTDSGGPMTNSSISFTVSEPNGLTLPTNLFQAVQAVYGPLAATQPKNNNVPKSEINYAAALYCMVIRFYGYDEAGHLVVPIDNSPDSTDTRVAVEKFIFYQQNSLSYSLSSKLVEYKITGSVPSTQTGFSSNRGSIPANWQFTGNTVKDVLVGQVKQQTASQAAGDNTRNGVPISPAVPGTGIDQNIVNPQGMGFGGGGL